MITNQTDRSFENAKCVFLAAPDREVGLVREDKAKKSENATDSASGNIADGNFIQKGIGAFKTLGSKVIQFNSIQSLN